VWHVRRPQPEPAAVDRAVEAIRSARRPLLVAGGGVVYSEAEDALVQLAEATGIPVADTHAGKGAIGWDHPQAVGGVGSTGTPVANRLARDADVVIGVGTRYSDFTTASRTQFADPDVRFVNLNVTPFDSAKHSAVSVVTDAREGLAALAEGLGDWHVGEEYVAAYREHMGAWNAEVDRAFHLGHEPLPAQTEVLGALHDVLDPSDVIVQAAGSLPGDLQMLWRASEAKAYNVEYAYSCMGYEVAGGLGTKMADPRREVFVLVGDGSYLMMAQEIATAVSEGVKLNIVLVQNHGFASIGALSDSVGSQRFGTSYRQRNPETGRLDGEFVPVDLAANAASLGADVIRTATIDEFRAALAKSRDSARTTVVEIQTDPLAPVPSSESWWDVPVAETSALDSTRAARAAYEEGKAGQRGYLRPADTDTNERHRG
jgi:3D-(3,5/4)-trihydroxycyclohexane-1,2-dione acylhydrolase (decyclizing)